MLSLSYNYSESSTLLSDWKSIAAPILIGSKTSSTNTEVCINTFSVAHSQLYSEFSSDASVELGGSTLIRSTLGMLLTVEHHREHLWVVILLPTPTLSSVIVLWVFTKPKGASIYWTTGIEHKLHDNPFIVRLAVWVMTPPTEPYSAVHFRSCTSLLSI